MDDGVVHFALRKLQHLAVTPRVWGTLVGIAVLLGAAGPFGTYESIPFLPRIAYWFGIASSTFAAGYVTALLVVTALPKAMPRLLRLALAGLAASFPVTLNVVAFNRALFGHFESAGSILTLYANCAVISTAVVYLFTLLDRPVPADAPAQTKTPAAAIATPDAPSPAPAATEPAAPARPPIVERLPHRLRGKLISLTVQDHYVEVRTDQGTGLVLIRLADAIRETTGVPGLQIHRSHWVALDAVEGSVRRDGRLMLKLPGGVLLPVSRSQMEAVRKAGLA